MSLNSSEEDSDHQSKLQEQIENNTKMQQKKLKIVEKETASRPKKVNKGNIKKVEETQKDGNDKKIGMITI